MTTQNHDTHKDTKTLIAVILLIFLYPVGLLVMWFWTSWKKWIKILITLPIVLIPTLALIILATINPGEQMERARRAARQTCISSCEYNHTNSGLETDACYERCDETLTH